MNQHELIDQYNTEGYVVVPALFSHEEVETIKAHFMELNKQGHGFRGDDKSLLGDDDPLKAFPRMVHPHRFDELSLNWLLDSRLQTWTTDLLGEEPYAAQTMFYFKPPAARGQALHQDQRPLAVHPGVCLAAWMAVDDCDEENGCLQVVPRTHNLPELCMIDADTTQSFSDKQVPIPEGSSPTPVIMKAGDVLFFNGQVIHGSFPNTSTDRYRRSLIAHYVAGEAEKVSEFYHPLLTFDGKEVMLESSETGGPCGVFVDDVEGQAIKIVEP
jgi:phytanoyl-CoA hydroxylase